MLSLRLTRFLLCLQTVAFLFLCSPPTHAAETTTRAQQKAERQRAREAEKLARREAEEKKQREEEQQEAIQKYAEFSTDQLRIKLRSLDSQVARGWGGTGFGMLIAKGIYDGKVKERDAIAMEILRRGEQVDDPPSEQSAPKGANSGDGPRSGTGFLITEDGYLITNDHVVQGDRKIRVRTTAGEYQAVVVRLDTANDLALLKIEGKHAALPIRGSRSVRLGESVATVGFPNPELQGFSPKLTRGEISSLAGIQDDPRTFQVSLPVQPGNSGGALVDAKGNVVGVIVARLSQRAALATTGTLAENVSYAIKSSFLLGFLESLAGVGDRIAEAQTGTRSFEDVVANAEKATALILVD